MIMYCWLIILVLLIGTSFPLDDSTGIDFVKWLNQELDQNVYPQPKKLFLRESGIFKRKNKHPQIVLEKFVNELTELFKNVEDAVREIRDVVEYDYYQKGTRKAHDCCSISKSVLVNYNESCDIIPPLSGDPWLPSDNVTRVMRNNHRNRGIVFSQYFGSSEGAFVIVPVKRRLDKCIHFDSRLRPWYRDAMRILVKHVVILIDTSSSMALPNPSDGHISTLSTVKNAVFKVIDMLSRDDKVSIVAFSQSAMTPSGFSGADACFRKHLGAASSLNKAHLKHFVGNLVPRGSADVWKGLEAAIELFENHKSTENSANVILLVTDGHKHKRINENHNRSRGIQEKLQKLDIKLMSYVVSESPDPEYETLLRNLSVRPEAFHYINNSSNLEVNLATFYTKVHTIESSLYLRAHTTFSIPYRDYFGLGQLVAVCQTALSHIGVPIGVVCTDVPILNITSILDFPGSSDTSADHYVFLMDMHGNMIHHPVLYYDDGLTSGDLKVNLDQVECQPSDSIKLLELLKTRKVGVDSCTKRIIPHGSLDDGMRLEEKKSKYWCSSLDVASYRTLYVCLVQSVHKVLDNSYNLVKANNITVSAAFGYENLEFTRKQGNRCDSEGQVSSNDFVSFSYSYRAFKDAYKHLSVETKQQQQEEVRRIERELYQDMSDKEALLKVGVKDTTLYLMNFLGSWLHEQKNSNLYRRYICVENGMLALTPAAQLPRNYDCTARPWYRRSMAYPDLIIATPYLWGKRNRFLITLSTYLSVEGYPFGVLACSLSPKYFQTALIDNVPICKEKNIDCMLMDNQGNMVVHQHIVSFCNSTYEKMHITSKEPALASDLIERNLMQMKTCMDIMSSKLYQWFDIQLLPRGQPYKSESGGYFIFPLLHTNLFLIVKNTSISINCLHCCDCSSKLFNSLNSEKCLHKTPHGCECPCYRDDDNFDFCNAEYYVKRFQRPLCATKGQDTLDSVNLDEYRKKLIKQEGSKQLKACFKERGVECDDINT